MEIDAKDAESIRNAMSCAYGEGQWDDPHLMARIKVAFPHLQIDPWLLPGWKASEIPIHN